MYWASRKQEKKKDTRKTKQRTCRGNVEVGDHMGALYKVHNKYEWPEGAQSSMREITRGCGAAQTWAKWCAQGESRSESLDHFPPRGKTSFPERVLRAFAFLIVSSFFFLWFSFKVRGRLLTIPCPSHKIISPLMSILLPVFPYPRKLGKKKTKRVCVADVGPCSTVSLLRKKKKKNIVYAPKSFRSHTPISRQPRGNWEVLHRKRPRTLLQRDLP